ncbi:MAG: hypothetical protein DME89_07750 [Verrucomicrobia bacterium]|nr:MAG: hypothetical protein DME89_07750 [Verrucomicrobiota bacterium]
MLWFIIFLFDQISGDSRSNDSDAQRRLSILRLHPRNPGGRVVIPAIDAPKSKFKTARDAVKLSLDQEIHVTQQINGLVELARKQNDYITINFLQWFLTEQLEEVSSMDNLLKILERAGNDLLQADEYLARVGVRAIPAPPKE